MTIGVWLLQLILVPLLSPLAVGIIKTCKARLQNRQGPPVTQSYKNLWKLLHKDEVLSPEASWIFRYTPYILFTVTIIAGASIPLFTCALVNPLTADLLVIIYLLAMGTFFMALAGMDCGGPFGGFGSSREMTLAALAEGAFLFSMLTVGYVAGSSNVMVIASTGLVAHSQHFLAIALAFGGFFIVLLAENARYPFDNPATHLELTMIHEAMLIEYSGKRLALMEWAAANKLFIFMALAANLFFSEGIAHHLSMGAVCMGVAALCVKALLFCGVIAVLESVMAKFRFFRLPNLLMIAFILDVVALCMVN